MPDFAYDRVARPADSPAGGWAIALDGGTTNTRARLLDGDRVVATSRRAVGVRDTVLGDRGSPSGTGAAAGTTPRREGLVRAVREVVEEVRRAFEASAGPGRRGADATGLAFLVAAGMLSSEVGLVAIPHVAAPAGLDDLARAAVPVSLPEVDGRPILVVPGVRTPAADGPDGWFDADVMRGEECETLGAYLALRAEGRIAPGDCPAFLWPGSHTKLVDVGPDGRIARSGTTLAGEMLQAVGRHTILAASLPESLPDDPDPDAVAAGARAVARHGLGRAAFLVRIAALGEVLDPAARAAFWMGAVVAADLDGLEGHPILGPGRPVFVGGRQPLRSLYADGLARRHDGPVVTLDEPLADAAPALGARAVAVRRMQIDRGPDAGPDRSAR